MNICEEMKKLRSFLDNNHIKWRDNSDDMINICRTRFEIGNINFSVINGENTYGGSKGLLELSIWDKEGDGLNPSGWYSARDVIRVIKEFGRR